MASSGSVDMIVVWEWFMQGVWRPYDSLITNFIEKFRNTTTRINLGAVDQKLIMYDIDFRLQTQIRHGTGTSRPIRRQIYPRDHPAGKGTIWQWEADQPGNWQMFDMITLALVESAFMQGHPTLDLSKLPQGCMPYILDLTKMKQVRIETGNMRNIRRTTLSYSYPVTVATSMMSPMGPSLHLSQGSPMTLTAPQAHPMSLSQQTLSSPIQQLQSLQQPMPAHMHHPHILQQHHMLQQQKLQQGQAPQHQQPSLQLPSHQQQQQRPLSRQQQISQQNQPLHPLIPQRQYALSCLEQLSPQASLQQQQQQQHPAVCVEQPSPQNSLFQQSQQSSQQQKQRPLSRQQEPPPLPQLHLSQQQRPSSRQQEPSSQQRPPSRQQESSTQLYSPQPQAQQQRPLSRQQESSTQLYSPQQQSQQQQQLLSRQQETFTQLYPQQQLKHRPLSHQQETTSQLYSQQQPQHTQSRQQETTSQLYQQHQQRPLSRQQETSSQMYTQQLQQQHSMSRQETAMQVYPQPHHSLSRQQDTSQLYTQQQHPLSHREPSPQLRQQQQQQQQQQQLQAQQSTQQQRSLSHREASPKLQQQSPQQQRPLSRQQEPSSLLPQQQLQQPSPQQQQQLQQPSPQQQQQLQQPSPQQQQQLQQPSPQQQQQLQQPSPQQQQQQLQQPSPQQQQQLQQPSPQQQQQQLQQPALQQQLQQPSPQQQQQQLQQPSPQQQQQQLQQPSPQQQQQLQQPSPQQQQQQLQQPALQQQLQQPAPQQQQQQQQLQQPAPQQQQQLQQQQHLQQPAPQQQQQQHLQQPAPQQQQQQQQLQQPAPQQQRPLSRHQELSPHQQQQCSLSEQQQESSSQLQQHSLSQQQESSSQLYPYQPHLQQHQLQQEILSHQLIPQQQHQQYLPSPHPEQSHLVYPQYPYPQKPLQQQQQQPHPPTSQKTSSQTTVKGQKQTQRNQQKVSTPAPIPKIPPGLANLGAQHSVGLSLAMNPNSSFSGVIPPLPGLTAAINQNGLPSKSTKRSLTKSSSLPSTLESQTSCVPPFSSSSSSVPTHSEFLASALDAKLTKKLKMNNIGHKVPSASAAMSTSKFQHSNTILHPQPHPVSSICPPGAGQFAVNPHQHPSHQHHPFHNSYMIPNPAAPTNHQLPVSPGLNLGGGSSVNGSQSNVPTSRKSIAGPPMVSHISPSPQKHPHHQQQQSYPNQHPQSDLQNSSGSMGKISGGMNPQISHPLIQQPHRQIQPHRQLIPQHPLQGGHLAMGPHQQIPLQHPLNLQQRHPHQPPHHIPHYPGYSNGGLGHLPNGAPLFHMSGPGHPSLVNSSVPITQGSNMKTIGRLLSPVVSNITNILMSPAIPVRLPTQMHPSNSLASEYQNHGRIPLTKSTSKLRHSAEDVLKNYMTTVDQPPTEEDCCICCEKVDQPSGYGDGKDKVCVKLKRCGHFFHRLCLFAMYNNGHKDGSIQCPTCKTIYGKKLGNCPDGEMDYMTIAESLPGHTDCGTIRILYDIKPSIQGSEHPNPGKRFTTKGFPRCCYLPDNEKGRKVLRLLIKAWKRRLIFTIGTSTTTGEPNTVTWNEIHHKTELYTNYTGHGYPDPNYLDNVLLELAAQGVTDDGDDDDDDDDNNVKSGSVACGTEAGVGVELMANK